MQKFRELQTLINKSIELEDIYNKENVNKKALLETRIDLLQKIKSVMELSIDHIDDTIWELDFDRKSNDELSFNSKELFEFLEEKMDGNTSEKYGTKTVIYETVMGPTPVSEGITVLGPVNYLPKLKNKYKSETEIYEDIKNIAMYGDDLFITLPRMNKDDDFIEEVSDISNGINILEAQDGDRILLIGGVHFNETNEIVANVVDTAKIYGVNFTSDQYDLHKNTSKKVRI